MIVASPITPIEHVLAHILDWLGPHGTSACRGRGRSSG